MGGHSSKEGVAVSLEHLKLLTDSVGVIQHALYGIPRRCTGYTTDDNARALIALARCSNVCPSREIEGLASIYLSFLHDAQETTGWFRNLMNYDRTWMDPERGDEDSLGRAFWALAEVEISDLPESQKAAARHMSARAAPLLSELSSPRALALALLGCALSSDSAGARFRKDAINSLGKRLCECYDAASSHDWPWFETYLTYCNARLPASLFAAYRRTGNARFLPVAEDTTSFLTEITFVEGVLQPIGNAGWFVKGGKRAFYDQQPVDASASTELYVQAYHATGKPMYSELAHRGYSWYLGANIHRLPLADVGKGACYDGLTPEGVNLNQGAEACTTFLMATLALNSLA